MPEPTFTHALLSMFVCAEDADAIEGDLLEENVDNRLAFFGNVLLTAGALLIHQLRQTPMPVFIVCIICIMFLKILEMVGLILMLFVLGLNSVPILSALSIFSVAIGASFLAVFTCIRWMPGFGKPEVAVTASILMVYALANSAVILVLAGNGMAGAAVKLMIFETLFHILPILLVGLHYGKSLNGDITFFSLKGPGY